MIFTFYLEIDDNLTYKIPLSRGVDLMHHIVIKIILEENMKKVLIGFAMIALLLCFTTAPASAQAKGKCVELYYDWTGTGSYDGPEITWFDANGTFISLANSGLWYENKGAKVWIYNDAPHSFYAGKKNSGYMRADGTWSVGELPGMWYIKGTKKTNCNFVITTSAPEGQGQGANGAPFNLSE